MTLLIGLLLVALSIGVVVLPFYRGRRDVDANGDAGFLDANEVRRRGLYEEIETLELERNVGNVDQEEYHRRLQALRMAAAATFREQDRDRLLRESADRGIEREVLDIRRSRLGSQTSLPQEPGHGEDTGSTS